MSDKSQSSSRQSNFNESKTAGKGNEFNRASKGKPLFQEQRKAPFQKTGQSK